MELVWHLAKDFGWVDECCRWNKHEIISTCIRTDFWLLNVDASGRWREVITRSSWHNIRKEASLLVEKTYQNWFVLMKCKDLHDQYMSRPQESSMMNKITCRHMISSISRIATAHHTTFPLIPSTVAVPPISKDQFDLLPADKILFLLTKVNNLKDPLNQSVFSFKKVWYWNGME